MLFKLRCMVFLLSIFLLSACNLENEAVPATATSVSPQIVASSTATESSGAIDISSATSTKTAIPTATFTPSPTATAPDTEIPIIGQHRVRSGETYFCIGRAYGVLPNAIQEMNDNQPLVVGEVIDIPREQWSPIPSGAVCQSQFISPFPTGVPSTAPTAIIPLNPTVTVPLNPTDIPIPTDEPIPTADCTKTRVGCGRTGG